MRTDTHIQTRRMHTHSPAESTPVLHMNDITVKFSGEVWAVGEDGGQGGGEERCERENISQITSRFSHPPRPCYLTFHNRALSPSSILSDPDVELIRPELLLLLTSPSISPSLLNKYISSKKLLLGVWVDFKLIVKATLCKWQNSNLRHRHCQVTTVTI